MDGLRRAQGRAHDPRRCLRGARHRPAFRHRPDRSPDGPTRPHGPRGALAVAALSGIALALDPPRPGVRACDRCGWFFIDSSRGRRRRWCSMKTCGNQAKAARYRSSRPG
ncbi:CGNR zinc finger domain-containing protein [Streptomyces marincola]|uniref:CGNR zinc finger domain-containing protein n=1 Tax=Streptomyces marincola TaxID=2878388 RepID=UPI0034CE9A90